MSLFRFGVIVLLAGAGAAYGGYGADSPRLEHLYGDFIAPCCWRENLTTHDSPAADALRGRIQTHVEQGWTDEEIKTALVSEYGARILSLPEGSSRVWLFWTPLAAGLAGLAVVLFRLKRLRSPQLAAESGQAPAELEPGWDRE